MDKYTRAWVSRLNPHVTSAPASPWSNVSDERYGEALELALDRLAKLGEYREATSDEVDDALETLLTDEDYRCG